eukprot:4199163-Prymnesium_polylepis.1
MLPNLSSAGHRCAIYVHDTRSHCGAGRRARHFACTEPPAGFEHSQYAVEHWTHRALLENHAWRVASPEEADLVHIAANFSRTCASGRRYAQHSLWQSLLQDRVLWPRGPLNASSSTFKLIALQYAGCGEPWKVGGVAPLAKPRDVLTLVDRLNPGAAEQKKRMGIVVPFVVSSPEWLVGEVSVRSTDAEPPPPPVRWAARKLVFLAGHVPKLYISPLRYLLWQQVPTRSGLEPRTAV